MVQPRPATVMTVGGESLRLFEDEVRRPEAPTAPVAPALEQRVSEGLQQPPERGGGTVKVRNPDLDVVQHSADGPGHAADTIENVPAGQPGSHDAPTGMASHRRLPTGSVTLEQVRHVAGES
ncbi:hypothetical protein ATKI12_8861 [Kitasatospora sp. Ki12]